MPASLPSVPGKVMKEILLDGGIQRRIKKNKVVRNYQHEFTKHKSCLTHFIVSHNETTGLVEV